jgi:hypothetical protein
MNCLSQGPSYWHLTKSHVLAMLGCPPVTVGPGAALVASLVQRVAGGDAPEEEES